jgi:hypothetical protein
VTHRLFHFILPISLPLAAAFALAVPDAAHAGNRPAQACSPIADVPGTHGLWLGHFTGGRKIPEYRVVEWRDDYACFTSAADCTAWRRDLRRAYRDVEGHGTCLPLRAGGVATYVAPVVYESIVTSRY